MATISIIALAVSALAVSALAAFGLVAVFFTMAAACINAIPSK